MLESLVVASELGNERMLEVVVRSGYSGRAAALAKALFGFFDLPSGAEGVPRLLHALGHVGLSGGSLRGTPPPLGKLLAAC